MNYLGFTEDKLNELNFINEVKIFNELQNHKRILIFDLRSIDQFTHTHLEHAINIPFNSTDDDTFSKFEGAKYAMFADSEEAKLMIERFMRYYIVIVMSEIKIKRKVIMKILHTKEDSGKEIIKKSLLLYNALQKRKVREIGLYNLGFRKFADHYSFIIMKNNNRALTKYL
jgi:hypothetical protein